MKKKPLLLLLAGILCPISLASCSPTPVYSVKFMNESALFAEVQVEQGKTVAKPSQNPTKASETKGGKYYSYAFKDWLNNQVTYDFSSPVTSNLTLYANYIESTKNIYTVTFKNGSETFTTQSVIDGNKATKPAENPTKAETVYKTYTFDHWEKDGTSGIAFDFENTPITGETTLIATYKEVDKKYTVTFMNGSEKHESKSLVAGTQIVAPTQNPTKKDEGGYCFLFQGWSEDEKTVITTFPEIVEDKTYYAVYLKQAITYTCQVEYNYAGGPETENIEYTIEDDRAKLASDVKALLPEETIDDKFAFNEEIPDELPLENVTYHINKISKYFVADMSKEDVNEHLSFIKRSSEEIETSLSMLDNKIHLVTSNDYILIDNKYTNFDLEFNMKINNFNKMKVVLGTDSDNILLNHGVDDQSESNGVVGLTLVPGHSSYPVRVFASGGTTYPTANIDTSIAFNQNNGVKVNVRVRSYQCEVLFNDNIVSMFSFTKDQFTIGKQIGFAFSDPGNTSSVDMSSFAIKAFNDVSFNLKAEDLKRAPEQLVGHNTSVVYNSNTETFDAAYQTSGTTKFYSFHKISKNFKMGIKVKCTGANTDRIDLLFGLQEQDLTAAFNAGTNNNHTTHPGVLNALIVPNHSTANVRIFYDGIQEQQFKPVAPSANIQTSFVNLEVSCCNGTFTFSINGTVNNTYEIPNEYFPERGFMGVCTGQGTNGIVTFTDMYVIDNYIPQ